MFDLAGGEVAQAGVESVGVVEVDDVVGDVALGLGVVGVGLAPEALHLEAEEEALGDGVIPTIALATHAGLELVLGQQGGVGVASVLAATVGVYQESGLGLACGDGHV